MIKNERKQVIYVHLCLKVSRERQREGVWATGPPFLFRLKVFEMLLQLHTSKREQGIDRYKMRRERERGWGEGRNKG